MNILAIASVEDRANIDTQILKQTIQPTRVMYYLDPEPAKGINNRRMRIAENQDKLSEFVKAYKPDYVWQLEADSVLADDCLERLIGQYLRLQDDNFGFISGVQVGRHGLYHIGAWHVAADKQSFKSIDHNLKGIQQVDATGFYCLFAPADVWLSGVATWTDEAYGPDVNWGLSIKQNKYVDMDNHVGHKTNTGIIWPDHISTCTVEFKKLNDKWSYTTT